MDRDVRQRLHWVKLFEKERDAGLVYRRCGISRPTLRKWVRRYRESGLDGLRSRSRRPSSSPNRKVTPEFEKWIIGLRLKRRLGARRIQTELLRLHNCRLSLATIHKVLIRRVVAGCMV